MLEQNNAIRVFPKYLWFLILCYAMIIVLANWFDARLIHIFGLNTDAGTLVFPLTFLLCDLITEVYGYKQARRAIWCGFLFNAIFILYGQVVIHLPGPSYATQNALFDAILATNTRIIFASTISYFVSEPVNSLIIAKLKIKMHGKNMAARFVLSTIAASGLDSLVFGTLAFYGTMNNSNLITLILTMWLIKVVVEIVGLPLSIYLTNKLKKAEQLDIYDENTKFNIFSLNASYTAQNNAYKNQLNK